MFAMNNIKRMRLLGTVILMYQEKEKKIMFD